MARVVGKSKYKSKAEAPSALEELALTFLGLATDENSALTAVRLLEDACKLSEKDHLLANPRGEHLSAATGKTIKTEKAVKTDTLGHVLKRKKLGTPRPGEHIPSQNQAEKQDESSSSSDPKPQKRKSSLDTGVRKDENNKFLANKADLDEKVMISMLQSGLKGLHFATPLVPSSELKLSDENHDSKASRDFPPVVSAVPCIPVLLDAETVKLEPADAPRKRAKPTVIPPLAIPAEPLDSQAISATKWQEEVQRAASWLGAVNLGRSRPRFKQLSKRSRSVSEGRKKKRSMKAEDRPCYMKVMGINHYAMCEASISSSSDSSQPKIPVLTSKLCDHLGKRKRVAQVLLCSQCAEVVERGGVFKAHNACIRRRIRAKADRVPAEPTRTKKVRSPREKADALLRSPSGEEIKREIASKLVKRDDPNSSLEQSDCEPSQKEKELKKKIASSQPISPSNLHGGSKIATSRIGPSCSLEELQHSLSATNQSGPTQWEKLVSEDVSKKGEKRDVVGCRIKVNQEDSLRARGWETWLVHPEFSLPQNKEGHVLPLLEGMYLSLDKTNRKHEASKVTRNRRNLTKKMNHKIDTLTSELLISISDIGITTADIDKVHEDNDLLEKLRKVCSRSARKARPLTEPLHILILAIEKVSKGKVIIHFQNLLPEFKQTVENSLALRKKEGEKGASTNNSKPDDQAQRKRQIEVKEEALPKEKLTPKTTQQNSNKVEVLSKKACDARNNLKVHEKLTQNKENGSLKRKAVELPLVQEAQKSIS